MVAKDFEGPDVASEELRDRMSFQRRRMVKNAALSLRRLLCLPGHPNASETRDLEVGGEVEEKNTVSCDEAVGQDEIVDQKPLPKIPISLTSAIASESTISLVSTPASSTTNLLQKPESGLSSRRNHNNLRILSRSGQFMKQLLKPAPLVIIFAVVISVADPIKALFLAPSATFHPGFRPVAPDGQPPLAFILDMASFVGASYAPMGLLCLGSAIGSLQLRSKEPLPTAAITALTMTKMVVTPLIGLGVTRWFVHLGFIHSDDKVLQFVCMCVVSSFSCHWGTPLLKICVTAVIFYFLH